MEFDGENFHLVIMERGLKVEEETISSLNFLEHLIKKVMQPTVSLEWVEVK